MDHISSDEFTGAMALAATAVSVVTTDGPAGRCGITVSAVASVSADPPLVLACINRRSPAAAARTANGAFAVSFLAERDRDVAETFAGRPRAGTPFDFARHVWIEGACGLPLLADAVTAFECETEEAYDAGTHRIFLGRVIAARRGDSEPLVYCNRQFRRTAGMEGES
jgi:flavin reductase